MATDKELKRAKEVFDSICKELDDRKWTYEKDEAKLSINFGVKGDDLPMSFIVTCDAQRQLIRLLSYLPVKMKEEKVVEGAIAILLANYITADGSFDYDIHDGSIFFRMTSSFRDSLIGQELLEYMVDVACLTVDDFNDKFEGLNNGTLSLEDFIRECYDSSDKS